MSGAGGICGNQGQSTVDWLALNGNTGEIVRAYVGDRSRKGAQGLWASLPPFDRQCAVSYTDFWSAYNQVFPSKRHQIVGKDSGQSKAALKYD